MGKVFSYRKNVKYELAIRGPGFSKSAMAPLFFFVWFAMRGK